jgi:hypothetical protein
MRSFVLILIGLLLLGGLVAMQVFLSRAKSPWPGLILPLVLFLCALVMTLNVWVVPEATMKEKVAFPLLVFFLGNIPTLLALGVYAACRKRPDGGEELGKMSIQDLE